MATPINSVAPCARMLEITSRNQYGGESLESIYAKIRFLSEHGRVIRRESAGGTYYAVGPHVWFVLSATQYHYSGEYCAEHGNKYRRAIDDADQDGRRIFYEEYSDTIRQAPQNYVLAVRHEGRFVPAPDRASTINGHSLSIALSQIADAPSEQDLAKRLNDAFYGPQAVDPVTQAIAFGVVRREESFGVCFVRKGERRNKNGYRYLVWSHSMSHTARRTRAGMRQWLEITGLAIDRVRGFVSPRCVALKGSWRSCSLLEKSLYDALRSRGKQYPWMDNGRYTECTVVTIDGENVVFYCNPNVRDRAEFDYFETNRRVG